MKTVMILILAIVGLWALGIFLGAIGGLSRPFTHTAPVIDSASIKSQEEQTIENAKDRQQRLMDDIKQKIRDERQTYQGS